MSHKLSRQFFLRPTVMVAKDLLGKYLIRKTLDGKIAGKIVEVESYPAFTDQVSHGNRRTARTEVMYSAGGRAYVYLVYGMHYQFAVVVSRPAIPEVVFIRAVIPTEGIEIMKRNFRRPVKKFNDLTRSPGNLCKAFGIDLKMYGVELTGNKLWVEDRGDLVKPRDIKASKRIGIDPRLKGAGRKLRFCI
ncbi:MAG: DNA-3-methyladenine glycosylase [Patescibacteria group bacterium]